MGQIEDLEIFTAIVEAGSLTKAAKGLGIAKSAVSRRLSLLEQRFNTVLIEREPGRWRLTDRGAELLSRARLLVAEANALEMDFRDERLALTGPLSVSLPRDFGLGYLAEPLQQFMALYPGIELRVSFDDRLVDLRHENFDAALRITPGEPSEVAAEKLSSTHAYLCASPTYLKTNPSIHEPSDLEEQTFLGYGLAQRATLLLGEQTISLRATHATNSGAQMFEWTRAGFGVAALPDFLCLPALEAGELVRLLPGYPLPDLGIYLCRLKTAAPNRRVNLFTQFLKGLLVSSDKTAE